ncbi:glycosyltransferase [Flavobacteriaceae bacterium XHP0103]|uniref:glycosyltransferase family 2 protein n=1 Tax=Marixanthotalea marina TaxID=2844359 RepID=UPI002989E475|nr:glycosyltransferase [Marixanthotalea marina]MBU3821258.1 glycosyltransferase [Marixanthotalea marina]
MTIGIILIFYNNENNLNEDIFSEIIYQSKQIPICLVNNGSADKTVTILKSFNEKFQSKLTIVDIKKNKGIAFAIKAGARYLTNTNNLKYIGYLNLDSSLNLNTINKFLEFLEINKKALIGYNTKRLENKKFQRTWFKDLFSITNFLDFVSIDVQLK